MDEYITLEWDKRTMTMEVDMDIESEGIRIDAHFILESEYNENGVKVTEKILDEEEEVIYEMKLETLIPGYTLPIFLAVSALATIGLVYIVTHKRK
jgi:hypothetical protein